ncbi:hypothetical protein NDU88_002381 [Pleurodeles waltl]|uniref:Uncharacterized protein n=1 Tax=Pleurodeles waltl TaxID=8319 RepID=A0AAV7UC73_PLEWA|nr:hypothetical protein NDU88_002381 [Pleurodeles waltl]
MRSSGLSCPPLCPRYVAGTNRGSGAPPARPGPACIGRLGTGPPSQAATACPRGLRGLSSLGSLTCRLCLPARSLSPHAGSVLVSAPPPSGALGPRSTAPRVATVPVLAIVRRACLRNHDTASQGHPRWIRIDVPCRHGCLYRCASSLVLYSKVMTGNRSRLVILQAYLPAD